jgi:molecular chaperone GrpE
MTRREKLEKKQSQKKPGGKHGSKAAITDKRAAHDAEKEKVKAALKASEEKYHELHDKYLRLSAEFDNYRKRTIKEKSELIKMAGEDLIMKILPVMDNFERGLKAMEQSADVSALKEGVVLIYNRFKEFLTQQGIREITAVNEHFDIDHHEAITKIPAPTEELKGKVVDVVEKGYTLHDKVIRYSKVVVGE